MVVQFTNHDIGVLVNKYIVEVKTIVAKLNNMLTAIKFTLTFSSGLVSSLVSLVSESKCLVTFVLKKSSNAQLHTSGNYILVETLFAFNLLKSKW